MNSPNAVIVPPSAAGRFYPAQPDTLREEILHYLREADCAPSEQPVFAILTPHAGYPYSGPIAACAFRHVENQPPETALFIALSHQGVKAASVFSGQGFHTPLGNVQIDAEFSEALMQDGPPLFNDPSPFMGEHSIEVNLPFLQMLFPEARAAAILISKNDANLCRDVGLRISEAIRRFPHKRILLIISSDLSHYPPYEVAQEIDHSTLAALETLDIDRIHQLWSEWRPQPERNLHCMMCGSAAMLTALEAAHALGASRAHILGYRNSGDSPYGDSSRVVGYGALAIYYPLAHEIRNNAPAVTGNAALLEADRRVLLRIVRQAIHERLRGATPHSRCDTPALLAPSGCFVTLKNNHTLRGCIGCFTPHDKPLYLVAVEAGIDAACNDARFTPIHSKELPWVDIQLSVVSQPTPIQSTEEIRIGRDGLQIRGIDSQGRVRHGTLLPQVATERNWDVTQFLQAVCVKAGLPQDAWNDPKSVLSTYQAEIFGDLDYGNPPFHCENQAQ